MAKQMSFEAPDGTLHPESYWRCVQCNIGVADRSAHLTFYGYKDEAARRAGRAPLAGAVKSYPLSGESFEGYYKALIAGDTNPVRLAYQIAEETQDVGDAKERTSFFADAKDV